LEGPDAKSVRKEINLQKDLIRIQEEQIAELQRKIDTRDSVLAALKRESQQQNAEIDSYKKKMNSLLDTQNAKLVPLDQQLESISSQMQQESERRIRLEQEKKSKSLLAFKEKRALQEQIQECTTKLDSLKVQAQDCEQRKIAISSKYSKRKDELQGAINAAALKQQQAEEQIRQLQNDIRKHVTEKQLNARKLELEQMLKNVDELEDKANRLRNKYMKVHLRMDIHDFEKWLEGGKW
jgi:chromosome segregation ATPase